jgi:hypothetical protein
LHEATEIGDIDLLANPTLSLSEQRREALLNGYRARASNDSDAEAEAVQALLALTDDQKKEAVATLLAEHGATHEAFQIATRIATTREYPGPSLFWDRRMRATLDDPGFPDVATQRGLFKYWTTMHTKPDVCDEKKPPAFCRMIRRRSARRAFASDRASHPRLKDQGGIEIMKTTDSQRRLARAPASFH